MQTPTLAALGRFWARFGLISWGGMWSMLPRLEAEMIANGWITRERFRETMAASVLVPGPTFLTLAGMTGYQFAGLLGAAVSLLSLMLPPTLVVSAAMTWVSPELLAGPLAPVSRGLTVAVAGVLLGNGWRLAATATRRSWRGPVLMALTSVAMLAQVPVPLTVIGALLLGAVLFREVHP